MTDTPPVVRSVEVARPPKEAFEIFTLEFGRWWPYRGGHSIDEEAVEEVVMEPHAAGRIYERHKDGSEHLWGTISTFEAPNRLVFSWHPGRTEGITEVEIVFTETASGTHVELTHRNWEVFRERAEKMRASYERGWPIVMQKFEEFAGREG